RVYISIGQALCLTVNTGPATTISDPTGFDPLAPNYYVIYDKFEFHLVPPDPALNIVGGVWIDTTAVDFFGIPMTLTMNGLTAGLTQSRASLLSTLGNALAASPWSLLTLNAPSSLGGSAPLRVMSANEAIGSSNAAANFPSDYFDDYIAAIWAFYESNQLSIDCSQLIGVNGLNITAANSLFTGQVSNGNFVFTNAAPTTTVTLPLPTSNDVLGCNGPTTSDPWTPQDSTAQGVIVTALDAAMNTGILPLPPSTPAPILMSPFDPSELPPYYQNSPQLPADMQSGGSNPGPWYNLYSAALHSTGDAIYAFAFDDEAGQSSTLSSADITSVATIAVNDLTGTELPVLTNDEQYTITFITGDGAEGSVNGTALPAEASTQVGNLPSSFTLTYNTGSGNQNYTVNVATGSSCPMLPGFLPSGTGTTLTIQLPGGTLPST
ncbi:MAG: beta-1,3-glucanase family protein, partial [Thermoanaerobaculia bacterium]